MKHKKHPHAAALERVGRKAVVEHFRISEPAYSRWTICGVPKNCLKPLAILAVMHGVPVPELGEGGL